MKKTAVRRYGAQLGRALLATTALVSCVTVAAAQDRAAKPAQPSQSVTLDTITLTAKKAKTEGTGSYAAGQASTATGLALSIRETPQSVTVVTDQQIKDQALGSAREVLNSVTGVTSVRSESDRVFTFSRGYYVDNFILDGVNLAGDRSFYTGVMLGSSSATYDRVEVLRGAASLLSGTGDPGAAVAVTRKRADATEQQGQIELRYGNWNRVGGTVDIGAPLNADATVRGRFIIDVASEDAYYDRYHLNRQAYFGTVEADLTPSTKLIFSIEHRNNDPRATMWGALPASFSNGKPTRFPRNFSVAPNWAHWDSRQTMANARLEHEFDNGWKAEASLGLTMRRYDARLLYIYQNPDPITGEGLAASAWAGLEHNKLLTFDAKANGPVELFGRSHEVNFGVTGQTDWLKRSWPGHNGTLPPIGSIFDWDGNYPEPDWKPHTDPGWSKNVTQMSAYASGRFSITDPLTVVLGGRYTDWKSEYEKDQRHFSQFTPFAGIVYDVTDQWSLYASYTNIFNPQNYRDRHGNYLKPIVGRSYELGAKAELFDGNVNGTVALFDTLQNNAPVRDGVIRVPGSKDFAYKAIEGARTQGVELEVSGEIRPGWNLAFGATALKMRQPDGKTYKPDMPRRSMKLFTSYKLPDSKWTVGGGIRWQSDTWAEVKEGAKVFRAEQPAYTVVDVMARYDFNDRWAAQLNVGNVLDKTYYNQPYSQIVYGEPRNAMLTLVSKF